MVSAKEAALFLLQMDKEGTMFTDHLMERKGRKFYEGNARLNKYLHLAQNIYLTKTGSRLFPEPIYAYDNGGVIPEVQENYRFLNAKKNDMPVEISEDIKGFLTKIYAIFRNAPIEKLIELSHEDPEWIRKNHFYTKSEQKMETESCLQEYKKRYADIIRVMDGMAV